jgi:5-methylcytosine-specific restriction protein A
MARDKTNSRWSDKGWDKRHRESRLGWASRRKQAMERDRWLCQPCFKKGHITVATECDHLVPVFDGGGEEIENLQAICAECHAIKTADEAARARGFRVRKAIGTDGWPIE